MRFKTLLLFFVINVSSFVFAQVKQTNIITCTKQQESYVVGSLITKIRTAQVRFLLQNKTDTIKAVSDTIRNYENIHRIVLKNKTSWIISDLGPNKPSLYLVKVMKKNRSPEVENYANYCRFVNAYCEDCKAATETIDSITIQKTSINEKGEKSVIREFVIKVNDERKFYVTDRN